MRITNDKQLISAENERANESKKLDSRKKSEAQSKPKMPVSTASDALILSSGVREVAELALQLKDASEVREDKVNELREMIKSGKYSIKGSDIAEKIMRNAVNKTF